MKLKIEDFLRSDDLKSISSKKSTYKSYTRSQNDLLNVRD